MRGAATRRGRRHVRKLPSRRVSSVYPRIALRTMSSPSRNPSSPRRASRRRLSSPRARRSLIRALSTLSPPSSAKCSRLALGVVRRASRQTPSLPRPPRLDASPISEISIGGGEEDRFPTSAGASNFTFLSAAFALASRSTRGTARRSRAPRPPPPAARASGPSARARDPPRA